MVSSIYPHYAKYVAAFKDKFSLDYDEMENCYLRFSDSVGVYPDVGFLLYNLLSLDGITNVVEFGSGMSTLVMSQASQRFGKNFSSYDSSDIWVERVNRATKEYGIVSQNVYNCLDKPKVLDKLDFLFIDGLLDDFSDGANPAGRLTVAQHYSENIKEAIIAFDDAQWLKDDLEKWFSSLSYSRRTVWYNPTTRTDRHIYISIPKSKDFCLDTISECCNVI